MSRNRWMMLLAAVPLLAGAAACSEDGTTPKVEEETLFLSVAPAGGATDVDPNGLVEVRFDHPMMSGMEAFAVLHLVDVTGPAVDGTWSFSPDRTVLAFAPDVPLEPSTGYTIHLGGGMMDDEGRAVDWETHGPGMGGEWATDTMMSSGTGRGMGMGGALGTDHMSAGWQHENGSFGMVFSFDTAG
ncbi:MAG: Ig-like domain-containing protein [Gemmatimonadetes bacterium]|nr:Ig-like domain-containing protein [Gemmatimonadota bacterium]